MKLNCRSALRRWGICVCVQVSFSFHARAYPIVVRVSACHDTLLTTLRQNNAPYTPHPTPTTHQSAHGTQVAQQPVVVLLPHHEQRVSQSERQFLGRVWLHIIEQCHGQWWRWLPSGGASRRRGLLPAPFQVHGCTAHGSHCSDDRPCPVPHGRLRSQYRTPDESRHYRTHIATGAAHEIFYRFGCTQAPHCTPVACCSH